MTGLFINNLKFSATVVVYPVSNNPFNLFFSLHVAVKKSMMTCVDVMLNENPDLSTVDMQGRFANLLYVDVKIILSLLDLFQ